MQDEIRRDGFRDLLYHSELMTFARQVLTESYIEAAPDYETKMRDLMAQTFDQLLEARVDQTKLRITVHDLVEKVFTKADPDFWFNRVYKNYKREIKPKRRLGNLLPLLQGNMLLDFGCGDGLTSLALASQGFDVYLTDILDYRDERAKGLQFKANVNPGKIPFRGQRFDVAILFAVLHHVETQQLISLLTDLRTHSKRIIIEEDCYDLPKNLPGLTQARAEDEHLNTFMQLAIEDQFRYLMFVDYFANILAQGILDMHIPFNFRTVHAWHDLFHSLGFQVRDTLVLGFQKGFFNRSCHVWFVLECD